jgi:hypothetical protein
MDSQHIQDQHIVARYLADQLPDAEREAFEAYCRDHPEMFRELEMTARFKNGLAKLAADGELDAIVSKTPGPGAFLWRHAAGISTLAAGLLIAASIYGLRTSTIGSNVAQVSGHFRTTLPVAASYELVRMRDSGDIDLRVALPTTPGVLRIRVLPDAENSAAYQAILSREVTPGATQEVGQVSDVRPDDKHFVSIYLNSSKLAPGTYSLIVVPDDSRRAEPESSFRIAFVEAP